MSAVLEQPIPELIPEEVVIIDYDPIFMKIIGRYFSDIGVEKTHVFNDSKKAWKFLESRQNGPDLIVMDWQLEGLPGVSLFNRLKASAVFQDVPVLICSGTLEKEDFQLLGEWPLSHFMPKPFTQSKLQSKIEDMIKERNWQCENGGIIESLLFTLTPKNTKANINKVKTHIGTAPNPIPTALLACSLLRNQEYYVEAEEIAREVVFAEPNSILAKNELAKALILQGRHKAAGEVLRDADQMSPRNIERLCLMGEVGLNLSNPVAAREMFNRALKIDPESPRPRAGLHMVEVVEKNAGRFQSSGDNVANNFASILNTVAIAKIHAEQYQKGIEQYRSALTFLNTKITTSKLAFNLGLAYLKSGEVNEAYPWFIQCLQLNPEMHKAKKYVARLRKYFDSKSSRTSWKKLKESLEEDGNIDIDWE